jgi:hypothetical protein
MEFCDVKKYFYKVFLRSNAIQWSQDKKGNVDGYKK